MQSYAAAPPLRATSSIDIIFFMILSITNFVHLLHADDFAFTGLMPASL